MKYDKNKNIKSKSDKATQQKEKSSREGTKIRHPLIYTLRIPIKTLN